MVLMTTMQIEEPDPIIDHIERVGKIEDAPNVPYDGGDQPKTPEEEEEEDGQ